VTIRTFALIRLAVSDESNAFCKSDLVLLHLAFRTPVTIIVRDGWPTQRGVRLCGVFRISTRSL
jgi:hypothetical protein